MQGPYLAYEEYLDLGGTADSSSFPILEFKARKRIDELTDCRVRDHMAVVSEAVKFCMKSLIDIESSTGAERQATAPVVTSFSTDGYSESYGQALSAEQSSVTQDAVIHQMLYGETDDNGTPLLFLGVRG